MPLVVTFYVEREEYASRDLYNFLEEEGRHVILIIDETPLDHLARIQARLEEFSDRVRVVTLGPAVRQPS